MFMLWYGRQIGNTKMASLFKALFIWAKYFHDLVVARCLHINHVLYTRFLYLSYLFDGMTVKTSNYLNSIIYKSTKNNLLTLGSISESSTTFTSFDCWLCDPQHSYPVSNWLVREITAIFSCHSQSDWSFV